MSSRDELLRILEPPMSKWVLPSSGEIARAYGSALPADYMWFIEVYGPGVIAGYLNILGPLAASEVGVVPGVAPMSAEQFLQFDEVDDIEPGYLGAGGLVTWGFDLNNIRFSGARLVNPMCGRWSFDAIVRGRGRLADAASSLRMVRERSFL